MYSLGNSQARKGLLVVIGESTLVSFCGGLGESKVHMPCANNEAIKTKGRRSLAAASSRRAIL